MYSFSYKEDKTQWLKQNPPVEVTYVLELSRSDDPALISFIERISGKTANENTSELKLHYTLRESGGVKLDAYFNEAIVDEKAARDINQKIKTSNALFLYNSATRPEDLFYDEGRRRMSYDVLMSREERHELDEASQNLERRLRRLARQHKKGLNDMLGRLSEKYDVEFSPPEARGTRHMLMGISLKDKHVEVPLDDWGSGTQNRTQIMMVILQASRIKTTVPQDDKITPIILVEEPESFLHPSAQAEFGRILQCLADELAVQILVTTHSPYMLNRENPESNILLTRRVNRGKAYETCVEETSGDGWMAPFADHLGLEPKDFEAWRPVFSGHRPKVLLVEGETDKRYFEFFRDNPSGAPALSADIQVVPYGGKDALKNTLLVKFVLSQFDRVFVTYDLDADCEAKPALLRVGLRESQHFLALGVNQKGKDCIEGLLPERILSSVMARETDLVMKLGSTERKEAKESLKKLFLEEFLKHSDYAADELKHFAKIVSLVNSKLCP